MARKRHIRPADKSGADTNAKLVADQAVALAEYAAKALVAAEQLRIKSKMVGELSIHESERVVLAGLPGLTAKVKKKLTKEEADYTVAEVAGLTMAVSESFPEVEQEQQVVLLKTVRRLMDCLQKNIVMPDEPAEMTNPKAADLLYQFKITLKDSRPPIWRRIQVKDGTLDKLHEHIQTAMGWTNSHLHYFQVGEQLYGDPLLMQETFEEMGYRDSTRTKIRDILPKTGKRFRFGYEYDFGDSWHHDVLFESCVQADPGGRYPVCVKGARACPPEDVGGVSGYADFLDAIQHPDHEQHEDMLGWIGGAFDPEDFDPAAATTTMRRGLPDWRRRQ